MNYFKSLTAIALSFFCAGSQFIYSQKMQQKYFTVYLNNQKENCSIKAEVCNKKSKIRYSDTLKYYWYSADKIIATQGASEGKVLHGKYLSFYYNNNLKEQGRYKKGLQNGQWMKWNNAGTLQEINHWHKGYRQGKQILFDSLGSKVIERSYKSGKFHGVSMIYKDGKIVSRKKFKKGVEVLPKENKAEGTEKNAKHISFDKIKSLFKTKPKETKSDNTVKANTRDKNDNNPPAEKKAREKKAKQPKQSKTPPTPANTTNADQPK